MRRARARHDLDLRLTLNHLLGGGVTNDDPAGLISRHVICSAYRVCRTCYFRKSMSSQGLTMLCDNRAAIFFIAHTAQGHMLEMLILPRFFEVLR